MVIYFESNGVLAGLVLGVLLQQVLMAVLFTMVRLEYRLRISFNKWTILMTALCYAGCYLLALIRCRRKFKKMSIQGLMNVKRQNEEIPFSQDGHNGADYVIIVPDEVLKRMKPCYSELAAAFSGKPSGNLQKSLDALQRKKDTEFLENFSFGEVYGEEDYLCCGSDNIIVYAAEDLVRDEMIPEVKYMLASLIIPLFYIGLVFVCVAVTVLSVQQLSDLAKYKYRYEVLAKLGLDGSQLSGLILKQLSAYYLCPALPAFLISGKMILFAGSRFVMMTGVPVSPGRFFAKSVFLFFGIYLVYFAVTYICFKRNVEEKL